MLPSVSPLSSARRPVGATTRFGKIDVHRISTLGLEVTLSGKDLALKPHPDLPDNFVMHLGTDPQYQNRMRLTWSEFEKHHEVDTNPFTGKVTERDMVYEHSKDTYSGDRAAFAPLFNKMALRIPIPNPLLKQKLMDARVEASSVDAASNVANDMTRYPNLSFDNVIRDFEVSQSVTMALNTAKSWIYKPAPATEDARYQNAVIHLAKEVLDLTRKNIAEAKEPKDAVYKSALKANDCIEKYLSEAEVPVKDRPKATRDALVLAADNFLKYYPHKGFDYKQFETMPQALGEYKAWASPAEESRVAQLMTKLEPSFVKIRDALQPHLNGVDPIPYASPAFWFKPFSHFVSRRVDE